MEIGGRKVKALVDSGCSKSIVSSNFGDKCRGNCNVVAFDGSVVKCKGESNVTITVNNMTLNVDMVVTDKIIPGIEVILGLDVIYQLGGVRIQPGLVTFDGYPNMLKKTAAVCSQTVTKEIKIEDKDFSAVFNGEFWTVKYFWKDKAPVLINKVDCYHNIKDKEVKMKFESEIEKWIEEGVLVPWQSYANDGIIPLMAVIQPTKNKVRPVLDFRELNNYVESHTGDEIALCDDTLRCWRKMKGATRIVDLKSAYLQLRIDADLYHYQLVKFRDKIYCLTRVGFGLNSAPRIMTRILREVLSKDEKIYKATKPYIDDIIVDESIVTAEEVVEHLLKFGLKTKSPEQLEDGRALGLKLHKDRAGELVFTRGNNLPVLDEDSRLSRRELFSICGKLVGHYPVAGWLRIACSYLKRLAEGHSWEDDVGELSLKILKEMLIEVSKCDPVYGKWYVQNSESGVVWCDASSIAIGIILEIEGNMVEDAAWLRKKSDHSHINVAELEAVLKGINLALKWGLKEIEIKTDSATVHSWVTSIITSDHRIKTKGAAEMLIRRRLGILHDLIEECELKLKITFVPSEKNHADALTRVKKNWMSETKVEEMKNMEICVAGLQNLSSLHKKHHFGVDRSLYLARMVDSCVTRSDVEKCVQGCIQCQSIDPAPAKHEIGELSVSHDWQRLAIDVTHFHCKLFLSIVDCGPGRFAIWKALSSESATEISNKVEEIFFERGPVNTLLMDNSLTFHSACLVELCDRWNVQRIYRTAHRASGNGIVERHHRTIKRMAERSRSSPIEAVFWYNLAPKKGIDKNTVPSKAIYTYDWRHPDVVVPIEKFEENLKVKVGEEVWVKPPNIRCTSRWQRGRVTKINSNNNVEINGMPRHILDVRKIVHFEEDIGNNEEEGTSTDSASRPQREHRTPSWMNDYVT